MYTSRSSNAYSLDWDYEVSSKPQKKAVKSKPVKKRKSKVKLSVSSPVTAALIAFLVLGLICYRSVVIYGLHEDIDVTTTNLEKVTRENEQMTIEINSMIDSSKISAYATETLGLQKIEDRQVIYLSSEGGDTMSKVALEEEKGFKGIFGFVSAALEYLK